jgi:hypothetical protein
MKPAAVALALALAGTCAVADDGRQAFIDANVITTFYHELGHALVDLLELPVLGREEDAVDALSTYLVHLLHDEETAAALIADTALGYELAMAEAEGARPEYWGVHSLDGQRLAMMVCHFYGAAPADRADLAADLGMPDDMAEACETEFAQVEAAWGAVLDRVAGYHGRAGLVLVPRGHDPRLEAVLAVEVDRINAEFGLPKSIDVVVEPCGEANAFYSLDDRRILLCTEFADWYAEAWDNAE